MNAQFAAISCIHVPHADPKIKDWLLDTLEGLDLTHFVLLGDLFDAAAASVFNDEVDHVLEDEYEIASEYLEDIRSVLPTTTKYIWMLGNHDDNLQANDARRIPKELRSLVQWNNHKDFGKEFRKWRQFPYEKSKKGCYQLGQVIFNHGYDCGQNSDELEGLQMAYSCGGAPSWRLTVRGHTHRPIPVTQAKRTAKVLLPHFYVNAGSIGLGSSQPNYMKRKDVTQWGAGIVVGCCKTGKNHRLKSREWDADLITYL